MINMISTSIEYINTQQSINQRKKMYNGEIFGKNKPF